jgi:hypothetical protein
MQGVRVGETGIGQRTGEKSRKSSKDGEPVILGAAAER